jgi:hypothetical protein
MFTDYGFSTCRDPAFPSKTARSTANASSLIPTASARTLASSPTYPAVSPRAAVPKKRKTPSLPLPIKFAASMSIFPTTLMPLAKSPSRAAAVLLRLPPLVAAATTMRVLRKARLALALRLPIRRLLTVLPPRLVVLVLLAPLSLLFLPCKRVQRRLFQTVDVPCRGVRGL